jgi:hypothetical protein
LTALAAADSAEVVVCHDIRTDHRWADLREAVRTMTDCHPAVISYPLPLPAPDRASLNFYSPTPGRWTCFTDVESGHIAAHIVAAGLAVLLSRRRTAHLERALESNRLIGAALGVLVTRHQWTYEQAFTQLTAASQATNRKIRDLADYVVQTGTLPADRSTRGERSC